MRVPDREGPHSIHFQHEVGAPLMVGCHHYFGIRIRGKALPESFQLPSKLDEVIDFAVVGNPIAVAKLQRLLSRVTEIEDSEPAVPQSYGSIQIQAGAIRSAMRAKVESAFGGVTGTAGRCLSCHWELVVSVGKATSEKAWGIILRKFFEGP